MKLVRFIVRSIVPAVLAVTVLQNSAAASGSGGAGGGRERLVISSREQGPNPVKLGLNKSIVIDLPRAAKDVLVSNPKKADAIMRTPRRAYIIGTGVGATNVFFFDERGKRIVALDLRIEQDLAALHALYERLFPGERIRAEILNESVVLTGSVKNAAMAAQAFKIASRFVDSDDRVINMLSVADKQQVFLKVVIAEVHREITRKLGINLKEKVMSVLDPKRFLEIASNPAFSETSGAISEMIAFSDRRSFDDKAELSGAGLIKALEKNQLLRTLAEPTLTAISGEEASFLAGGEFPIPVAEEDNKITVDYKPFGVSLGFVPIVLSGGRISLKVKTEVSEITPQGSINLGTAVSVPGLKVRRADTTVELPSGGSLVIAGLIQGTTQHGLNGFPGIKDTPILGSLFRSRDFQEEETEMLVLVTPYLARPVKRGDIALPTDMAADGGNGAAGLFGKINKIYGADGRAPSGGGAYGGKVGFIVQ